MAKKNPAFDVSLTDDEQTTLANDLCREVQGAFDARQAMIGDGGMIDLLDWFYEQGRSQPQDRPFPGAADLTSYFITEDLDAMRCRITKTTRAEPFCVVDAWGDSADKAPMVEAFHEWQIHEEGLPEELAKVAHGALLEDCYVLEVRERIETRKLTETLDVALVTGPEGGPVFGVDGKPQLQMDDQGEPVKAQPGQGSATVQRTHTKTRKLGPEYDVISMKDWVALPGHAKHRRQLWGYAKRFTLRVPEIAERVADGVYDAAAAEALGDNPDAPTTLPVAADVAPQRDQSAEKELFELSLKRDLDGDGREEWYVATLSLKYRVLLRLKLDALVQAIGKPRCVPFVLLPRRNSVYGYSYAEKHLTLAEEHTALRNMKADRSALATAAPMTVLQGALWDPQLQPFGVGRTLTVRDHNELRQLVVADVPNSVIDSERMLIQAKERVGGLADTAIGVQSQESRTLGENQMVAAGSAVRVEELVGHFQTAVATVMELRHAIWIDALEGTPGLDAPESVMDALSSRGIQLEGGKFTAEMLKGKFRFKPYGSVETADNSRRIQYFQQGLQALIQLAQAIPAYGQVLQNPDVVKMLMNEWALVYRVRSPQVFLKALAAPPQPALPAAGGMDAGGGQPSQPGMPGAAPSGPGAPAGAPPVDIHALLAHLAQGAPHAGVQ